ncbi:MAG: hypothetical protein ABIL09_19775 [Gemmatimonadota bacterium]
MIAARGAIAALVLLGLARATAVQAADEGFAQFRGEARLDGDVAVLRASVPFANLRVTGTDGTEIRVKARVEVRHPVPVRAEEIAAQAKLVLEREGGDARLAVEGLPTDTHDGASAAVELEIEMPRRVGVDLTCQFGDVKVEGVSGPIAVAARSGAIEVRDATGSAELSADFGKVTVTAGGEVRVAGRSAQVTLHGVQSARVESQFGTVTAADVAGDLDIEGSSARIAVDGVGGAVDIRDSFQLVEIRGSAGPVKVQTSGPITVAGIRQIPAGSQWLLATRFNPVTLVLPATADVTVRAFSQFGPVESDFPVERAQGWDEVATIRLGDADRAAIEIRNTKDIEVRREREGER